MRGRSLGARAPSKIERPPTVSVRVGVDVSVRKRASVLPLLESELVFELVSVSVLVLKSACPPTARSRERERERESNDSVGSGS